MLRTGDISAKPWFRPAIAAWFAVLFGGGTLAILLSIPREALEWRLGAIGLADLHPAFAPPVGGMGLLPLAGIAALIGLALGLYIADRVIRSQSAKPAAVSDTPWEADTRPPEPKVVEEEPAKIRVLSARDDIDEEGIPAPKADMPDNTIWLAGSEFDADPDVEAEVAANAASDADFSLDGEVSDDIEADADAPLEDIAHEVIEVGEFEEVEEEITLPTPRRPHFSEWQEVGSSEVDPVPLTEEAEAIELAELASDEIAEDVEEADDYLPDPQPPLREEPAIPQMYEAPQPDPEYQDDPEPETVFDAPEPEPEIVLEAPEPVVAPVPTPTTIAQPEPEAAFQPDPFPASAPASVSRPQPVATPDPAELSLDALASRLGRAMEDHRSRRISTDRAASHGMPVKYPSDSESGQQTPADSPGESQNALRDALEKLDNAGKRR